MSYCSDSRRDGPFLRYPNDKNLCGAEPDVASNIYSKELVGIIPMVSRLILREIFFYLGSVATFKYDNSGTSLWTATTTGNINDVALDPAYNSVYAGGAFYGTPTTTGDILKYSSFGCRSLESHDHTAILFYCFQRHRCRFIFKYLCRRGLSGHNVFTDTCLSYEIQQFRGSALERYTSIATVWRDVAVDSSGNSYAVGVQSTSTIISI